MSYQGKYFPKNPKKYIGDPNTIFFRSLWERKFMVWCDTTDSIINWSSEECIIKYKDPSKGFAVRRYFPDFLITVKLRDGTLKKRLIEIKPFAQTKEPVKKSRITKRYISEVMTYATNTAKWQAAAAVCEENGWEFQIITEKELFSGKK